MSAELQIIIKALDQASGPLKGVSGEIDNMGGKASRLGSILKGGLILGASAAVAGIGALGVVLKQSFDAASEAEQVTAQLNAVLASTGGVAGMTAEAINEHALALSELTRYEDEEIVSASSLLLTFTKIGKDVFPDATEATLDMATAMKMDLRSATLLVGKALNDPIKGMTALTRSGIQFTQQQKDMIEALVAAGDTLGAQRIILAELETQFGGSAKAAGETFAGQMDILKNALGNVKEEIGGALLPVLRELVTWAAPRLVSAFKKFSDWAVGGIEDIRAFVGRLGEAKDIIAGIVVDVGAGRGIRWAEVFKLADLFIEDRNMKVKLVEIAQDIASFIEDVKAAYDKGGIGAALAEIGGKISAVITDAWSSIDWNVVQAKLWLGLHEMKNDFQYEWDKLVLAVKSVDWASIGAAMQEAWDTLATWWETDAQPFAMQVATSISDWFVRQVIPELQKQAPVWGAELTKVLKSTITIGGFKLGEDANLAYTLGAGYIKLMVESLKALSIGPRLVYDALKKAFEGGISVDGANFGQIFGNIFKPIGDFLKGALDAMLVSLTGPMTDMISAWWNNLWASITGAISGGSGGASGAGSGTAPGSGQPHDPGGYVRSSTSASNRGMTSGMVVNLTINAPGGNPRAVAQAAQTGVLAAARSMGIA